MNLGMKPSSFTTSSNSWKSTDVVLDQFPVGLRVLVVDDDPTCLRILEKMLRNCLYEVTKCNRAEIALRLLRDNRNGYDVVISDVHMPDMDGFKLLEHIGLEMDLPVIMMSADDGKDVVMKGVTHGACDYLIKPVRMEALKNIWQHVVRKKKHEWKDKEYQQSGGSVEEGERQQQKQPSEDVDYSSSANEGNWKNSKKRKDEEDESEDRDDTSSLKKPRVVWSVELHQQFVTAVNQLGIDKAVPKKILELMNVPGLTRENVASHLQKYRLYLRRLSGVSPHQNGFMGPTDAATFGPISSINGFDLQSLAASGQLPPQSLATIQAATLGGGRGATTSKSSSPIPPLVVDQRNIFSFENHPRQQNIINGGKQVNLLHGIPTNMDSKQLVNLHQSAAQSFTNNLSQSNNSLLAHMVQPHPRTHILNNEINGTHHVSVVHGTAYNNSISNPSTTTVDFSSRSQSTELPVNNSFALVSSNSGMSNLTSKLQEEVNSGTRGGFVPNYDVFNDLSQNQNRGAHDWGGLQSSVGSSNIQQRLGGVSSSVLVRPNGFSSNQKSGPLNSSSLTTDNSLSRIKTEKLPDMGFQNGLYHEQFGQEDLMSALLKQQQEGMGSVENEFGFDGGYHLDNLPV
ncbi:hypothetical protein ACJIZ3_018162 [Penstemon smallii]|uniref:Two-component response regulator n=1 Tax=Penstemon smallii TaxID=265156 RepID=A0ABD3SYD1_9LAMI